MSHTFTPSLAGKVVVITGASSGLGEATARHLAARGAKLVLAARRTDKLQSLATELSAAGAEVLTQATDVTHMEQVQALADATLKRFGRIDVLVNNAGIMPLAPLDQSVAGFLKKSDNHRLFEKPAGTVELLREQAFEAVLGGKIQCCNGAVRVRVRGGLGSLGLFCSIHMGLGELVQVAQELAGDLWRQCARLALREGQSGAIKVVTERLAAADILHGNGIWGGHGQSLMANGMEERSDFK